MSRIRSIHPGFFKDDRLVPCSAFARLLFVGLGVEADDKGIFEWKPVTLKMSIFPGDHVDVEALLAELVNADAIKQFEAEGRRYGAIRNFRKYQKPKTPNDVYPMPDDIAQYVSFPRKGEMTPVERDQFPPNGEKSSLMEDGGGKREEEEAGSENTEPVIKVVPAVAGMKSDDRFAFQASTIRLTGKDLEQWRRNFPHLSLEAELWALDPWAGEQSNWFVAVSMALAKKERQLTERMHLATATRATRARSDPRL